MLSFIIGIIMRLANILFGFFPSLQNVLTGLSQAINFFISSSMAWNFIFPITDSLLLVVRAIQFEFAVMLLWFGKWLVEMIRGK